MQNSHIANFLAQHEKEQCYDGDDGDVDVHQYICTNCTPKIRNEEEGFSAWRRTTQGKNKWWAKKERNENSHLMVIAIIRNSVNAKTR